MRSPPAWTGRWGSAWPTAPSTTVCWAARLDRCCARSTCSIWSGEGGASQVQCFAARLDANHGIAACGRCGTASSLLSMDGDGSLNLGNETLDLRVRPETRIAGTALVVPMRITGPFRSPSSAPDPTATVTQNAGTVAGAVLGNTTPMGLIAGALGVKQLQGGSEADCGAALAAARGTAVPSGTVKSSAAGGASAETEAEAARRGQCAEAAVPLRGRA